jgi:hypothetical protein
MKLFNRYFYVDKLIQWGVDRGATFIVNHCFLFVSNVFVYLRDNVSDAIPGPPPTGSAVRPIGHLGGCLTHERLCNVACHRRYTGTVW